MSAPAANAFSLPVITIAPIAASASNASSCCPSSIMSWSQSAFSACGRFSRISPTAPWVSIRIISGMRVLVVGGAMYLRLKARAIERAPATLHGTGDAVADRRPGDAQARLALAAVDAPGMLEIAEFATGLDVVAQARAAGFDPLEQGRLDLRHEAPRRRVPGQPRRRDPGAVKRLAHVDI